MARLLLAPQVWRAERHHEMSMKPDMAHDHPELDQITAQVSGPAIVSMAWRRSSRRGSAALMVCGPAWISMVR